MTNHDKVERGEYWKGYFVLLPYGSIELASLYGLLEYLSYQLDEDVETSLTELAQLLYKSRNWVRKYLRLLQELGLIEIEHIVGKGMRIKVHDLSQLKDNPYQKSMAYPLGNTCWVLPKKYGIPDKHDTHTQKARHPYPIGMTHHEQTQSQSGVADPKEYKENKEPFSIEEEEGKTTLAPHPAEKEGEVKILEKASPSVKEKKDPHPPTSAAPPSPTGEDVPFFDGPLADPVVEVLKAYNEEYARPLGRREVSLRVSPTRKKRIKHLLKTYTVEDFRKVFQIARENPFLRGDVKDWHFTLSWLLKNDDNMDKILEGYYDDKAPARPVRQPTITDEKEEEMLKHDAEILLGLAELDEDIDNLGTSIDKDAV